MSKKPSKGELHAKADHVLDSLKGDGAPLSEVAVSLAAAPASARRDLLETLCDRARKRKFVAEATDIITLLSPLVSPGSANKPDFLPKYVRAVFDCAQVLSGGGMREIGPELFRALVASAGKDGPKASAGLAFDALGTIGSVVSAFDATLASGHADQLAPTRALWLPLVPEIMIQQPTPLSDVGRLALAGLLSINQHELSTAAKLSLLPLLRASVSDVRGGPRSEDDSHDAGMLPEIRVFSESLRSLLQKVSNDVGARLAAQSSQIDRAEAAKAEVMQDLARERRHVEDLLVAETRSNEQLAATTRKLEEKAGLLSEAKEQLEKYRKHHDIAIADAESRESESVARTKRGFADSQLVVLQSIRACLVELTRSHGMERSVRQAVSNFNNFSRFLSHNNYTTRGDLAKIESQSSSGAEPS